LAKVELSTVTLPLPTHSAPALPGVALPTNVQFWTLASLPPPRKSPPAWAPVWLLENVEAVSVSGTPS